MPLHLAALSRRQLLRQTAAAVGGLTLLPRGWGADSDGDQNSLVLLSDTHIPSNPQIVARDVNMTDNLRRVIAQLTRTSPPPAAVLINGDCAYLKGLPDDYANLAECLEPLAQAGLPVHLTMGNHDDRGPLYEALANQRPHQPLVESKHVSLLEFPHCNWFLLDSLFQVNVVTGDLGEQQRAWLQQALDQRADKPAIVMAHHTPQFEPPAEGKQWGGLRDTAEFMELLASRPHVKAFVFGHSHTWNVTRRDNLHLVNLPPVAYVFAAGQPNGWVDARMRADGLSLTLHTLDPEHSLNGQLVELDWT